MVKMDVNDKENVPVIVKLVKTYSGRRKSKKLSSDGTPLTVSLIVFVCSVKSNSKTQWLILKKKGGVCFTIYLILFTYV